MPVREGCERVGMGGGRVAGREKRVGGEKKWKNTVRNEGRAAAGRQNVLNKYDNHSSPITLSRTCDARAAVDVHFLHALGEHKFTDVTCGRGKAKRGEGIK